MDVFEEIVRPLSEICTCLLTAPHHGVDDGGILSSIVIATEEIVLPANGYRTYAVLDEIVVWQIASIQMVACEPIKYIVV